VNTLTETGRYPLSKLLQLYCVRKFASLHPYSKTGVVINYVSPGLCWTKLSRNAPPPVWLYIAMLRLFFARSAEVGSRTLLHAAVAGKESHGKYLASCSIEE
jgi:hypothetical protein